MREEQRVPAREEEGKEQGSTGAAGAVVEVGERDVLSRLSQSLSLCRVSHSLTRSLTLLHSLTRRHFLSRQSIAGASVGTRHLETRMTLHVLLSCRSQVVIRTIFPASTTAPSPSCAQTVWLHTQLTLMPGARRAKLRCLRRRDGLIGIVRG